MRAHPTLVLDLDGTLADTAPDLAGTLNVVLAREGRAPIALDQVRSMVGAGAKALLVRGLAVAGDEVSPQRLDELYGDFLDHYLAHIADRSRLFPGVVEALDRFEAAGWRLAVCTNKLEGLSRALLDALGIASRFAVIHGGDSVAHRKPDPRHLLATIASAGGDRAHAVMVGDSATDIATAKAAGVPVVAVSFGYTEVPVAELGPDVVIDRFDQLYPAATRLLAARVPGQQAPVSAAR